jgi:hypothetical protein
MAGKTFQVIDRSSLWVQEDPSEQGCSKLQELTRSWLRIIARINGENVSMMFRRKNLSRSKTDWVGRLKERQGSRLNSGFPGRAFGRSSRPVTSFRQFQASKIVKSTCFLSDIQRFKSLPPLIISSARAKQSSEPIFPTGKGSTNGFLIDHCKGVVR